MIGGRHQGSRRTTGEGWDEFPVLALQSFHRLWNSWIFKILQGFVRLYTRMGGGSRRGRTSYTRSTPPALDASLLGGVCTLILHTTHPCNNFLLHFPKRCVKTCFLRHHLLITLICVCRHHIQDDRHHRKEKRRSISDYKNHDQQFYAPG